MSSMKSWKPSCKRPLYAFKLVCIHALKPLQFMEDFVSKISYKSLAACCKVMLQTRGNVWYCIVMYTYYSQYIKRYNKCAKWSFSVQFLNCNNLFLESGIRTYPRYIPSYKGKQGGNVEIWWVLWCWIVNSAFLMTQTRHKC